MNRTLELLRIKSATWATWATDSGPNSFMGVTSAAKRVEERAFTVAGGSGSLK
jgi:hypothetical protein